MVVTRSTQVILAITADVGCFLAAAVSGGDTLAMDELWLAVSHPLLADKHASLSSPPFPHLSSTWPPYSTGVGHERGRLRHAAGA